MRVAWAWIFGVLEQRMEKIGVNHILRVEGICFKNDRLQGSLGS